MSQEIGNPDSPKTLSDTAQIDSDLDSAVTFPETEDEERARIGKYFNTTYPDGCLPAVQIEPVQE